MTIPHTAGPWRATSFSSIAGCPIVAQPDPKRNSVIVAGVHGAFGDDYRSEVEANARLIAAAPEMLELLRECADFVQPFNRAEEFLDRIDAAIAKATGQ